MVKMKKFITFLTAVALMIVSALSYMPQNVSAKEVNVPKISWYGVEHSPLVEGEDEGVIAVSAGYFGKVQYRLWINKIGTNKWEDATGYTKAVYSEDAALINFNKSFQEGRYKVSLWVKRDGVDGKYKNSNGSYDNYKTFELNCISKKKAALSTFGNMEMNNTSFIEGEALKINGIKDLSNVSYKLHMYNTSIGSWEKNIADYKATVDYTALKPGKYVVDLWVRRDISSKIYDGWKLKVIEVKNDLTKVLDSTTATVSKKAVINDWDIMTLKMAGFDINSSLKNNFIDIKKKEISEKTSTFTVSDYAKGVLSLTAVGIDPSNFEGINFIEETKKHLNIDGNYPNQNIWGMIALETVKAEYDRETTIKTLEKLQMADGGFTYAEGWPSDPDLTAMAVQALTMAGKDKDYKAVKDALSYLKDNVNNGKFPYGENVNTLDQILMAVVSAKDDVNGYTINGRNIADEIMTYYNLNGNFKYQKSMANTDDMASLQSLQALLFYKNNNNMFFDIKK